MDVSYQHQYYPWACSNSPGHLVGVHSAAVVSNSSVYKFHYFFFFCFHQFILNTSTNIKLISRGGADTNQVTPALQVSRVSTLDSVKCLEKEEKSLSSDDCYSSPVTENIFYIIFLNF